MSHGGHNYQPSCSQGFFLGQGKGGYGNSPLDRKEKFKMVHRRWEELYDYDGSKKFKDAMKRHVYRNMYGHDALETAHMVMDGYNILSYE